MLGTSTSRAGFVSAASPMVLAALLVLGLSSEFLSTAATSYATRSGMAFGRHPFQVRGGDGGSSVYDSIRTAIVSKVLASDAMKKLHNTVNNEMSLVPNFGATADSVVSQAIQEFASTAAKSGSTVDSIEYDRALQQLEAAIDAPLHVLFLQQLSYLREQALETYRSTVQASSGTTPDQQTASDYAAFLRAEAVLNDGAAELQRPGGAAGHWSIAAEQSFLRRVLETYAASNQKLIRQQLTVSQQQQTALTFLQSQQQMIQQLQMQLYGQTSPWNVGIAYRIPDTNFNLQGSYQQGRANVQLSCVPDEYAPFLGPNGFTNGVGPGNLGLSLNLSV
jgi:hypothetical protein